MHLRDGRYECSDCGAILELSSLDEALRVVVYETTTEPKVRMLTLNGQEVHRCTVADMGDAPAHGK